MDQFKLAVVLSILAFGLSTFASLNDEENTHLETGEDRQKRIRMYTAGQLPENDPFKFLPASSKSFKGLLFSREHEVLARLLYPLCCCCSCCCWIVTHVQHKDTRWRYCFTLSRHGITCIGVLLTKWTSVYICLQK
jgi:hypothetical protein